MNEPEGKRSTARWPSGSTAAHCYAAFFNILRRPNATRLPTATPTPPGSQPMKSTATRSPVPSNSSSPSETCSPRACLDSMRRSSRWISASLARMSEIHPAITTTMANMKPCHGRFQYTKILSSDSAKVPSATMSDGNGVTNNATTSAAQENTIRRFRRDIRPCRLILALLVTRSPLQSTG